MAFRASPSVKGVPAGARNDGAVFEGEVKRFFAAVAGAAEMVGAASEPITLRGRTHRRVTIGPRSVYLPAPREPGRCPTAEEAAWLTCTFSLAPVVALLGQNALDRQAPLVGPFADSWAHQARGRKVVFDGVCVFTSSGVLDRRVLVEAKSAKVGPSGSLDGNAHERLAFGLAIYADLATLTAEDLRLVVIGNDAFAHGRSKYPLLFARQAEREAAHDARVRADFIWDEERLDAYGSAMIEWLEAVE